MIAVYKRELRSYLTSMIGYLFIFFILPFASLKTQTSYKNLVPLFFAL